MVFRQKSAVKQPVAIGKEAGAVRLGAKKMPEAVVCAEDKTYCLTV